MKYLLVFLFAVLFLFSCKDKIESNPSGSEMEKSYRYFPLIEGNYIIYDVDSIIHESADDHTVSPDALISYYHYQVKEMVDYSFVDGEGMVAWRISRYRRDVDSLPWDFVNVWPARRNNISAQKVEDNIRYVKLSFPVRLNDSWNGNSFNTFSQENYFYDEVNAPITIGGFSFDSSLTVIQNDESNALHDIFKKEKYVSGVGMVYKEIDSLNVNEMGKITNGFEYRMTLRDYFPK